MAIRNFNASQQTRTGTLTSVQENIEYTSNGFKSVATTLIPYVRSKTITFTAKSLKPFTRIYVYFDKRAVNAYVTPASTGAIGTANENFSNVVTPVAGSVLISDSLGNCNGSFSIPNPRKSGNPQFKTGNVEFVLTSNVNNAQVGAGANEIVERSTYAEAIYSATGILDTDQESIIATRNAIVKTTGLSKKSGIVLGDAGAGDPLAQTFIILDTDSLDVDEGATGAF